MSNVTDLLYSQLHDKPHKGGITAWRTIDWYGRVIVIGQFVNHPEFGDRYGHTSYIVNRDGCEIETRNSRYTLIGDEISPATVIPSSTLTGG
jgi:hypothetical protein